MIKKHGVPITGANPAGSEGRLLDITGTSRDAETLVTRRARNPYNPEGPAQIPTGSLDMSTLGEPYGQAQPVNARTRSMGSKPMSDAEMMAAVGYSEGDTRSSNSLISGHPTRNPRREVGSGNFPKNRR